MSDLDIVPYSQSRHPDPHRHAVSVAALLAGLFIPPIAWAGNLLIAYAMIGHYCYPGETPFIAPPPGFGFVWWFVLGIHILTLLVIAASFALSLRNWRVTGPPQDHAHQLMHRGEGRSRYFGIIGMGWAAIFFVIVLTQTVSLFWIVACER